MKNIFSSLSCATSVLLGLSGEAYAETLASDYAGWDLKTYLLFYKETDRVTATELGLLASKSLDTNETLDLKLTIDSLTGASASGALPSAQAQTFTRPSGAGTYTTPANETPLDDTFEDTRVSMSIDWSKPLSNRTNFKLGGSLSKEYDYSSLGINTGFDHSFNNNNTIFAAGVSYANDTINPEGGIPIAFAANTSAVVGSNRTGQEEDDKNTIDVLLGLTQIISKYSLVQFNYSYSGSDGYHNDPFKLISVVDDNTGEVLKSGSFANAIYENRPEVRDMHAVFLRYKKINKKKHVLDMSYRYAWDDWGIKSHTIDARYKLRLSSRSYIRPHIRFYSQSKADFYTPYFKNSDAPASGSNIFASADYRLGDMDAYTIGIEYGKDNIKRPWSVALEYYQQMPDKISTFGALNAQDINPDVDAVMLRINYDL